MLLETVLLHVGRDNLGWSAAAKTAAGMSLISMLTMEMAQNIVDYHLTGGTVAFDSPGFWVAAVVSMSAGFLTPLPYNYLRLRKYGKASPYYRCGVFDVKFHVIGDALNNIRVIIAALVIRLSAPARYYADPTVSFAIATAILLVCIPLVKNSGKVLM
ncbi:hypothetical protein AAE478_010373 [Parahypoxylon ruwenzoriense]